MKKFFVAFTAAAAMMLTACGAPVQQAAQCDPSQTDCSQQVVQAVQQTGGSFVQNHPIATAAIAAGGAYMVGKAVQNHRNGYNAGPMVGGYHQPYYRPAYVPVQRVYMRPAPYRVYGAPTRTITRTVTVRRR